MTDTSQHELVGADVPLGHTEDVPKPVLRRAIAASAVGNATEWFDYGIYAYGVVYLSAALFPGDTAEATLFALATRSQTSPARIKWLQPCRQETVRLTDIPRHRRRSRSRTIPLNCRDRKSVV